MRYRPALLIFCFFFFGLACNAPFLTPPPTIGPPPTLPPPEVIIDPIDNRVDTEPTATGGSDNNSAQPLPTFTPRSVIDLNVTETAVDIEATMTLSVTVTPTATEAFDIGGSLAFDYQISWIVDENNSGEAIATVTIIPSGGDGTYLYFRDELPVEGPVFTYRWATCAGNPSSLRVTSGDGQTLKLDYFESPPCP